jgi:uncharacterized membrane protein (UPF0127 family)
MFVQDRFDIFDVSFKDEVVQEVKEIVNIESDENEESAEVSNSDENYVEINIPNGLSVRVDVDIADTDVERSRGLSGRKLLGDYEGMLFVYEGEVDNPFWMKDMLIPLDIIFIDNGNIIVDIKEKQQPCSNSYCPSLYPNESYQYVLEVNSGFCEENGIEKGYSMVQYLQ